MYFFTFSQVAYTIVDKMHYKTPELVKDIYWDEIVPPELPHTIASLKCHKTPPGTSTDYIQVSNKEQEIVCLEPTRVTIGKNCVKFRKSGNMAEIVQLLEEQEKECNNGNSDGRIALNVTVQG